MGTTLVAPAAWSLAAVVALFLSGIALNDESPLRAPGWVQGGLLFAASATFCPGMALLGAKRPQDTAWQLIVLALWLVLSLPALAVWLGLGGGQLSWHPAQAWFLLILLLMEATNYFGTRYWLPVWLAVAGQVAVAHPFLPGGQSLGFLGGFGARGLVLLALAALVGALLLATGIAWWHTLRQATNQAVNDDELAQVNRLWLDFRDAFGVVWALRLMQRINQAAVQQQWPLQLEWNGFIVARSPNQAQKSESLLTSDDAASAQLPGQKVLIAHFQNVLRRFVSPEWIARRVGSNVN